MREAHARCAGAISVALINPRRWEVLPRVVVPVGGGMCACLRGNLGSFVGDCREFGLQSGLTLNVLGFYLSGFGE